jgi:methyltransferase (TIGR00027 family)
VSIVSFIVYIPLQVLFVPLAILGFGLVGYRQMVISKRLGISQTAIEALNGRWTMHIFGIRVDEASAKLVATLPNTSQFGLWLALTPLWVKFKMSGKLFLYPRIPETGAEALGELFVVRTLHFDRAISRAIGGVEQFVVMGAGYDTRAYGGLSGTGVTFFELDQASVQEHKRKALAKAGIPCEHVRFVPVDFASENVFDKLSESGFDQSKKSLFLWEGVTLYLSEIEVRKTMRDLRAHVPAGSILLADIYADRFVGFGKRSAVRKTLEYTNEGLGFSLPMDASYEEALLKFVESESMSVGETCFMGSTNDKGPFMVVAEVKC